MIFDTNDVAKKLGFQLDESQVNVLIQTLRCIGNKTHCCITGPAGSGKTQMAKALSVTLKKSMVNYLAVTPTNKAKLVLGKATDSEAITIHTLLSLSPELDILELDLKNLTFSPRNWDINIVSNSVWLVDECSMINDDLFDLLIKKADQYSCTIVFLGDESQLAPVKQRKVSKVFNLENKFQLTAVYRQDYYSEGKYTEYGSLLEKLRSRIILRFPIISGTTSISLFKSAKEWLDASSVLFADAVGVKDPNLVRILSYTNRRINYINTAIRKVLGFQKEFEIGELLTGYDTIPSLGIDNSEDYWVKSVSKGYHPKWNLPGYNLVLENNFGAYSIFVLTDELGATEKFLLASNLEKMRLRAIYSKKKSDWALYYEQANSFATTFDLEYEGKVIKKKTLGYGYCISIHKSQGSQFDNVFLDAISINQCPDNITKRQLQYVAASRTKQTLYVYQ